MPVLQGLERDDITHLPGGVLGRGYVRSFAAAVKLDPEVTVAEFVAQFPESSVKDGYPPAARIDGDTAEVRPSRNTTKIRLHDSGRFTRAASVGVIAVVFAGVIAFAAPKRWLPWTALQSWGTSAGVPTFRSAHEKQLRTLDARPLQLIRPSTPPTLSARALPVPVSAQASSAEVAASSKSASTPVAASLTATVVARESSSANGESAAGAKPAKARDATRRARETVKVVLSVTSPCWVIASVDGKKIVNRLLGVGEEETIEARRELVLTAGDAGAIVMTLNGQVAKSLGRAGQTVKVHVNRDNFRDYLRGDASSHR